MYAAMITDNMGIDDDTYDPSINKDNSLRKTWQLCKPNGTQPAFFLNTLVFLQDVIYLLIFM